MPKIATPTFIYGAKYQDHLLIACDLIQLYKKIVMNVTVANIQWVSIMRNFGEKYKSLTGWTVYVSAFNNNNKTLIIHVVDTAIEYYFSY